MPPTGCPPPHACPIQCHETGGALWGGGVSEPGGWKLRAPTLAVRTDPCLQQEPTNFLLTHRPLPAH